MTHIYHHTDSARLPWILRDQFLKPGANRVGKYPEDFLWATSNPDGDSTAAGANFHGGSVAKVRFTLEHDDFTPWTTVKETSPLWTSAHYARLENDIPLAQIAQWWCRNGLLTASRWLKVEFRTWSNPRWSTAPTSPEYVWRTAPTSPEYVMGREALGVRLDDTIFFSMQIDLPGTPIAYACAKAHYVG